MERLKRFSPVLIILFFALLPVWRAVISGEVIGPWEQIGSFFTGKAAENQNWDVLQADGALQFYAWRDLVFESWGRLEVPTWNPYQFGGTLLSANSQSAAFYPLHILCGILHIPTGLAIGLLAWFHLFWAGLGIFKLATRLGANATGALIGSLGLVLSPFMIGWVGLPSVITTCSWIPWLLLTYFNFVRPESEGRGRQRFFQFAGSVTMLILSGHLQFAAYGFFALLLFALTDLIPRNSGNESLPRPKPAKILLSLVAVVFGIGLSYQHLSGVMKQGGTSHRQNVPTAEGFAAYQASAIPIHVFNQALLPQANGLPTKGSTLDPSLGEYWPTYGKPVGNFAEFAFGNGFWIGLLALIGTAITIKRRQFQILSIGVLGALLAFGTPVNALLYFNFPGWSATGSPGRAAILIVLSVCLLAALGYSELEKLSNRSKLIVLTSGIFLLAISWLFTMGASNAVTQFDPAAVNSTVSGYQMSSLLAHFPTIVVGIILGTMLIGVPREKFLRHEWSVPVLCGLIAFASWGGIVRSAALPDSTGLQLDKNIRYAFVNENWSLFTPGMALMPPNLSTTFRVQDIAGYDSLIPRSVVESLRDINQQDPAPPANGNMMFVKRSAIPQKLSESGVTEIWSRSELSQFGTPYSVDQERQIAKYRIDGPGIAYTESGPAKIEWLSTNRLKVSGISGNTLQLKVRNDPQWRAFSGTDELSIQGDYWMTIPLELSDIVEITLVHGTNPSLSGILAILLHLILIAGCFLSLRQRGASLTHSAS